MFWTDGPVRELKVVINYYENGGYERPTRCFQLLSNPLTSVLEVHLLLSVDLIRRNAPLNLDTCFQIQCDSFWPLWYLIVDLRGTTWVFDRGYNQDSGRKGFPLLMRSGPCGLGVTFCVLTFPWLLRGLFSPFWIFISFLSWKLGLSIRHCSVIYLGGDQIPKNVDNKSVAPNWLFNSTD